MQSKKQSRIETLIQQVVGFGVALASQMLLFPLIGIDVTLAGNIGITIYFTIISMMRSYLIRRYYNNKHKTETLDKIKVLEACIKERDDLLLDIQRQCSEQRNKRKGE